MKNKTLSLCVFFVLILAACAPSTPNPVTLQTSPVPSPIASDTLAPPTSTSTPEPVSEDVLMVGQTLAQQLDLESTKVAIASLEKATWEDNCLGIALEGVTCTPKSTDGFIVVFQVGEDHYTYHMDESGEIVRLASAPVPQVGTPIISWQMQDDFCQSVLIGDEGVAFGECNAPMITTRLRNEERLSNLEYIAEAYFPFQADTPAGNVIFTGKGTLKPTLAEKRMVAEWARIVYMEAVAGHSSATFGLAFAWHREGGLAGFCDDISVYMTGEVYATSCKTGTSTGVGESRLDAAQLTQVYAWTDSLNHFEITQTEGEGVMDSMSTYLKFSGTGSNQPTLEDQQTLLDFASEIYAGFTPAGEVTDIDTARRVLFIFFQFLHDESYAEAVEYYGGSYDTLIDMNPDIPAGDFQALLENGCTTNGLQCKLIGSVVEETEISPQEFEFTVEFKNDDGSLFNLGPCCGASPTEEPPVTQFTFHVIKDGTSYLVQELPPFMP